jgi:uncharacterized integral membrane protein
VQSPRALGIFALGAVILAAISFASVDVVLTTVDDGSLPTLAVILALVGTGALLASVLPAIRWFVDAIHHSQHEADIEPMAMAVRRLSFEDDDL